VGLMARRSRQIFGPKSGPAITFYFSHDLRLARAGRAGGGYGGRRNEG
jgi:hypothetical protein